MQQERGYVAQVVRTVLVIVGVAVLLYLVYLLRKPIGWILIAAFVAVALNAPVDALSRRMKRGFAIALVYLGLFLVPIGLGALVIPPLVDQLTTLVNELPEYAQEAQEYVESNERLQQLEEDYDIFGRIEEEAQKLPDRIGSAAGTLSDVGIGLVNSVFALVNILVLTAFMLGSGRKWVDAGVKLVPPERRWRVRRVLDHAAAAIGGYVAGALTIALIAGISSFILMTILGVPFAAPLAVLAGFASLIPLVGATAAAFVIGLVTLFNDFPTDTIIWAIWAVVYQQLENNVIQPKIQARTVQVQPFLVLVSVLFGATLLGVLGALVAIPLAATIQVALREWWAWRTEQLRPEAISPKPAGSA